MAGIAVDNLELFYRTGYDEIAVEWQFNRWNINEVDSFQVRFLYTIKNSITGDEGKYAESSTTVDVASGFNDGTSITRWRATYSPPDDWYKVDVRVFPVSKTYDQDGKQMSYFTGETAWDVIYRSETRPEGPGNAPELVFGGVNSNGETKLLAQVSVPDNRVTQVEFEFHWLTIGGLPSSSIFRTVRTNPYNGYGSCNINAPSGYGFVVRCRFLNSGIGDYGYTEWSDYSNTVYTVPNSPTNLTAKASTKTSVYLRWENPDDAVFSNSSAVSLSMPSMLHNPSTPASIISGILVYPSLMSSLATISSTSRPTHKLLTICSISSVLLFVSSSSVTILMFQPVSLDASFTF